MNYEPNQGYPIRSGYIPRPWPEELGALAADYAAKTGCMPLFVIRQEVTMDPKPILKVFAQELRKQGSIREERIHNLSLLVLLSSGAPIQELLRQVLETAAGNDGLVFLEDAYRLGYNKRSALELMDWLSSMLQHGEIRCPVVLNLPAPSDMGVITSCKNMEENCFHLTDAPLSALRQRARLGEDEGLKPTPAPPERNRPAPTQMPVNEPRLPWYQRDPKLLDQEFLGLQKFLRQRMRQNCSISQPVQMGQTGRLMIQLELEFYGMGVCRLVLVYSSNFRKQTPGCVGVAIGGSDMKQLKYRLRSVSSLYDREVAGHLFQPAIAMDVLMNYGAGAAAVDGLIRAMAGI